MKNNAHDLNILPRVYDCGVFALKVWNLYISIPNSNAVSN